MACFLAAFGPCSLSLDFCVVSIRASVHGLISTGRSQSVREAALRKCFNIVWPLKILKIMGPYTRDTEAQRYNKGSEQREILATTMFETLFGRSGWHLGDACSFLNNVAPAKQ